MWTKLKIDVDRRSTLIDVDVGLRRAMSTVDQRSLMSMFSCEDWSLMSVRRLTSKSVADWNKTRPGPARERDCRLTHVLHRRYLGRAASALVDLQFRSSLSVNQDALW